jgi:hypothetical protein
MFPTIVPLETSSRIAMTFHAGVKRRGIRGARIQI